MMIGSFLPYFGGKRTLAPRIVELVCEGGRPSYFCEPFVGGGAVSLAMPDVTTHVVNDLNADVVNLMRCLALEGDRLRERARDVMCSEDVYRAFLAQPADQGSFARALRSLVIAWLGPNGFAGTHHNPRFPKRYGPGGGDPATRWRSVQESIDEWQTRARRWTILNEDGIDSCAKVHDERGVCIYADPPYLRATRASGDYIRDFYDNGGGGLHADDHARLADTLSAKTRARVIVSYYDHPRLDTLYPPSRWTKIVIPVAKNTTNASTASGPREATEVLLCNWSPS